MTPRKPTDPIPEDFIPLARLMRQWEDGNRVYSGNSLEIITSGRHKKELLMEDIRRARSFIHIEYFRFGNDEGGREIRDLLIEKASQGVEVRFLNNNWSGVVAIPNSYWKPLIKAGAEIIPFTHIRHGVRKWLFHINHQQHRKLVVIDGQVAYTGGMNLNDNYFRKWRDTHLRITGPAVTGLGESFMESWRAMGGRFCYPPAHYLPTPQPQPAPLEGKAIQLVSDSPEMPGSAMLAAYEWILGHARDYVYLQTPYFVPPDSLLDALKSAAARGVDVRLMLPYNVDTPFLRSANRAFYAECLRAGVKIGERMGEFIHCKTLVADDALAVVGASNLDCRSFFLNYEINTLIYDRETALLCKDIFYGDKERVHEWTLEEWLSGRRWYQTALSSFLRLFRSLL